MKRRGEWIGQRGRGKDRGEEERSCGEPNDQTSHEPEFAGSLNRRGSRRKWFGEGGNQGRGEGRTGRKRRSETKLNRLGKDKESGGKARSRRMGREGVGGGHWTMEMGKDQKKSGRAGLGRGGSKEGGRGGGKEEEGKERVGEVFIIISDTLGLFLIITRP